tara:strand:+ start:102 stop:434 length:333 start_codon:yes stop_codon:yes gene_type:complete
MTTLTKSQVKGLETALAHARHWNFVATDKVVSSLIRCANKQSQRTIMRTWKAKLRHCWINDLPQLGNYSEFFELPLEKQLEWVVEGLEAKIANVKILDVPGYKDLKGVTS